MVSREEIKIQGSKLWFLLDAHGFQSITESKFQRNGDEPGTRQWHTFPPLNCFLAPSEAASSFLPFGTLSLLRPLKYHQTPSNPERPVLHATFCYKAFPSLSLLRHATSHTTRVHCVALLSPSQGQTSVPFLSECLTPCGQGILQLHILGVSLNGLAGLR